MHPRAYDNQRTQARRPQAAALAMPQPSAFAFACLVSLPILVSLLIILPR